MSRLALAIVFVVLLAPNLRAADPQQAADKAAAAREAAQRAAEEAAAAARDAKAAAQAAADSARRTAAAKGESKDNRPIALFDGKSLDGWKETNFAGAGEIKVEKGQIVVQLGDSLTGITWKDAAKLPQDNYEITLAAMKLKGDDFFCGLTFPVRDSHASLILGGWGGHARGPVEHRRSGRE